MLILLLYKRKESDIFLVSNDVGILHLMFVFQVKIGNYYYDYGYMWYPWWLNKMIIIPVAVVGGLFVIVLLPALVIVKARQRKPKSDSQLDSAIVLPPVMTEDIEVQIERNYVILSRARKSARNRQTMDFPSYINVDREEDMEMK